MRPILVVDDASTVRMYHRQILENAGFVVEEAANGYEGFVLTPRNGQAAVAAE